MYAYDRNINTSSLSRWGGALNAVDIKLISKLFNLFICTIEIIFVSIKLYYKVCIIMSACFPTEDSLKLYMSYFNCINIISNIYPNAEYLLFGDSNLCIADYNNTDSIFLHNFFHCKY